MITKDHTGEDPPSPEASSDLFLVCVVIDMVGTQA